MGELKISVIMSAYNAEKTIEKAIKSVVDQTYNNYELIVIDDCSTDRTLEIAKEWENNNKRIKVINHSVNRGAGYSRASGLKASTGDYTMFLDSDDWYDEDYIETYVKAIEETNADIITGGYKVIIDHPNNKQEIKWLVPDKFYTTKNLFNTPKIEASRFLNTQCIRSSLWNRVKYSSWRYLEDSPTLIKLLSIAKSRQCINYAGYNYWQNPSSLIHTTSKYKNFIYSLLALVDVYDYVKDTEGLAARDSFRKLFDPFEYDDNPQDYKEELRTIEKFYIKRLHELLWGNQENIES